MLKAFLRKNKRIVSFYYKARFIAKAFSRNLFHLERFMLFMKVLPYTMAGYERLSNAYQLAKRAEKENLQGAFVECGVWKGGTIGIMAYAARKNPARSIWLCDSFEGLPEPGIKDGEVAKSYAKNKNSGNLNVTAKMKLRDSTFFPEQRQKLQPTCFLLASKHLEKKGKSKVFVFKEN